MQVTGSVLESLIANRTKYSQDCNRTLSTTSKTGKFPLKCFNFKYFNCYYICKILIFQPLQESTVKERLTCMCVGPIPLLGMCRSPVLRTYHGLVKVM